jgi:hypothetical protein
VYTSSTSSLGSGTNRTLSVRIEDAAGNLDTDSRATVTFAKTSGGATVSALGSVAAVHGIASKVLTAVLAGSVSITAGSSGLISATTTFPITAGTAKTLVFTSSTTNLTSGASRTMQAKIKDAAGNLVTSPNRSVTFTKTSGTATLTGLPATVSSSSGTASKSVTAAKAGAIAITASSSGLTSATTSLTIVHGAPAKLVYTSSTASLARGTSRTLSVKIEDAAGNLVPSPNFSVSFAKVSGTGTVSGMPAAVASASGVASRSVTATGAGPVSLRASAFLAGATRSSTTTFTVT